MPEADAIPTKPPSSPTRRGPPGSSIVDDRGSVIKVDTASVQRTIRQVGSRSKVMWFFTCIGVGAGVYGIFRIAINPAEFFKGFSPGILVFPLLAIAWNFYASRQERKRAPTITPTAAALLSIGRCGGCGYELATVPTSLDGHRRCPECGGSWHIDRTVFRPEDNPGKASLVLARLDTASNFQCGGFDDRLVPLAEAYQWPPPHLKWTPPSIHPAVAVLRSRVAERARFATGVLVALWGVCIALWLWFSDPHERETVTVLVVSVVLLGIGVAIARRWVLSPREVRSRILGSGHCPSCWSPMPLPPTPSAFDGCSLCPTCSAAWKWPEQPPGATPRAQPA